MKNVFAALITFCVVCANVSAQNRPIRPQALGISFIMNDFTTAERIRNSTLATVLRDKQFSKFKEMSPGLAVTYFKGLKPHIDFAGTLAASFVNYPLRNKSVQTNSESFLLEADASANFKMFDESYWVTPYFSAGLGASKFKGYYAAFVPLGLGFKVNLLDEASVFIGSQYRVPVTETANYHFMYNIGISGVIGK